MHPAPQSKAVPTVVGIGASAGGLAALKTFLQHVPQDSGLAIVVVVHLSPDHESHLAELLQPHVRFPVTQVTQNTLLERNHVYIIPPNANLNAIDTHLRLTKLEERRKERAPIDHFFRTLANTHDGHAIAVILTGTGTDGTLGITDIKANGGVVIVQDPNDAEFDGMPQSAISTGLHDYILPVAEIPACILRFDQVQPKVAMVSDEEEVAQDEKMLLYKIFTQLRVRTDRDFSRYKRSTVLRRVARRMQLNYIEDLGLYVERLRERPEEARALADDLLITVTHFFRDTEVFERLKNVELARMFDKRDPQDSVRAWCVGCATGEEAYSLAIVLMEEASRHEAPAKIQVFASDLHSRSLEKAREGFYPGDITADVSPERLQRFFQKESGGYRIRKELRELVVFTPHNLLADPPFSRLDLISCRNLLIYLERDVQQDVIELFHYALVPDGTLLLGSAESVDSSDLFRVEDKRLCLFRKRNVPPREPRLPVFPLIGTRFSQGNRSQQTENTKPVVYGSLHQQMVERFAPPSLLIGSDNKILHLSEHVGRYLVPPGGEPTQSAVKMVREELRVELQAGLHEARERNAIFDSKPIPVHFNGHASPVVLHVRPSFESEEQGYVLVIFEEREPEQSDGGEAKDPERLGAEQLRELESELDSARQRLQVMVEEYETSKEEMKASNEEMQSANEELRSTMEEFETSKEELQSINEELLTVNQQNRHKVEELSQLSNDLQNLLIATDIATLFLDRDLRILRFTPKLGNLFSILMTDRGRPISDLTNRLGYSGLIDDARMVLAQLVPIEREIEDEGGSTYLTRIHPYRSSDDRIEGAVVTFIDVTDRIEREKMRLELLKQEQSAAAARVIREKEAELARLSRVLMVGEFATSIAHELNQPLAGVVTNAEAAVRWLSGEAPNVEEVRASLNLIVRDSNRASAVIKRIREFVKNGTYVSTMLDLKEVVEETVELLRFDLKQNQIVLKMVFPEQLAPIRGDRVQLEQVILNLILNASEAMTAVEDRERVLEVRVAQAPDQTLAVSIRDSGTGIDPEQIGKIYDAFFTTKPTGIGMGLSISRSIVEAHGGQMSVVPNSGPGVTVEFRLPANGNHAP